MQGVGHQPAELLRLNGIRPHPRLCVLALKRHQCFMSWAWASSSANANAAFALSMPNLLARSRRLSNPGTMPSTGVADHCNVK